ncbi:MAG: Translocation and assembly module TamA [Chlamydiae bacterium]|nr:Translocation and assembly module TamA [Chlamydiota bacterium]
MKVILVAFALFIPWSLAAYQVSFTGAAPREVYETIEVVSQLKSEQDRPPPTLFTLKKRTERDKKTILEVLHAYGYYEGDVEISYVGAFPNTTVQIQIFAGPCYSFESLGVVDVWGIPLSLRIADFPVQVGCPALAESVLATEEEILGQLAYMSYPLATIANREVVVDQETKRVSVTFVVDSGPIAYFGPYSIHGLRSVRKGFVRKRILWKEGMLYNPYLIASTENHLQESGLFSRVWIEPSDTVDCDGYLPISIELEEKRYRHIGLGGSYSTDESLGVTGQWGHDNITGWGDSFSFTGEYSDVIKRGTFLYARPDFFGRNRDLLLSAEGRQEDVKAFNEDGVSLLGRFSHKVNNCFFYNVGLRYEWLKSSKSENNDVYHLVSLPLQIRWDTSNRLLNPTRGTTIAYFGTPYHSVGGAYSFFLKQELWAATYHPLLPSGNLLLALSGQIGSILEYSPGSIPVPKRFFAGSSTGLRGYKYLTVSPRDGDELTGGRSLLIFQIEPRIRIWQKLYFAAFTDFGNVYASEFPQLSKGILRSVGVGLRYLTPLGPFRLDIAFPLDKRKGIDKSFQIYASVGQTF